MAKQVKYTAAELAEINKLLIEQAKRQSEVSNSLEDYIEGLKKAKKLNETINDNKRIQAKFQKEIDEASAAGDAKAAKAAEFKKKILEKQNDLLEHQLKVLGASLKEVNKANLVGMKLGVGLVKAFTKLPDLVQNSFGKIKGLGLFEMDKAIKSSGLEMGLLGKQSKDFQASIREAALSTNDLGVGVVELAKLQAAYSEELGRTVMLNQKGLVAMSDMVSATNLGVEGTAKLAANMETQGLSAERTRDFVNDTMNDTSKMGLNASKIIKNIANSAKMLDKYNFKDGVKGLAKMSEIVSKLGVGMEFAAGMADKLFDIEGAVDMSAQLQVMGGAWAKLADPFKLMYMARNDMAGLTEELGKAAESAAHFNSKTNLFEISALEMHRLRKVADEIGVSYEELAQAGKKAATFTKIKSQLTFSVGGGKEGEELREFITNSATFEDGKAFIKIGPDKKLVSMLSDTDKATLKAQILEQASLKERAEASQTFDDKLTNLVNMMKTTMLPIVDGLDEVLGPLVRDLLHDTGFKTQMKNLGMFIGNLVKTGAGIVKSVADFAIWLGPTGTLATILGVKGLMSATSWIANGIALAEGFNIGTSGGGFLKGLLGMGSSLLKIATPLLAIAGGLTLGNKTGAGISKSLGNQDTMTGDVAGVGAGIAAGAGGWAIGAALAPETFGLSLLIPAITAAIGAWAGSTAGKVVGDELATPSHDAMFNSPIHDDVIGSDFSKGRAIIQGGRINPIDNKDDLIAMKPRGPIANTITQNNTQQTMKIDFGDIVFKGDIQLTTGNGQSVSIDLLKDQQFIRSMTRMVHIETDKAINGGKSKP